MTDILFSSWGGVITDNRGKAEAERQAVPNLNLPLEFDKEKKIKAFVGWDGIAIRDPEVDIVDLIRAYIEAVQKESCGKCTPCRVGTRVMATVMNRIADGQGRMEDLERLKEMGESILKSSKCNLGQTGPRPAASCHRSFQRQVPGRDPVEKEDPPSGIQAEGDRALRERLPLSSSDRPLCRIDQGGKIPRLPRSDPGGHLPCRGSGQGLREAL